jgi:hypothetical protein
MPRFLIAALALLPGAAFADDLLDRYEVASVAKAEQMEAFYAERVPELLEVLPEMGWDDEIAAVAQCTLDGVRAERGEAGAEEYVAAMETWADVPVTSFTQMAEGQPAVLSDDLAMQLTMDCGGMDLAMERMSASGMMELIQDPSIMERLMAE